LNTPLKLYGPLLLLIARLTPINVYAHQQLLSGTHKNLQRLVFCPIYSVVKYRPHWLAPIYPASAGMSLTQFGVCKPLTSSNPMFGASTTFMNRDTESVVVMTPNIGLIL